MKVKLDGVHVVGGVAYGPGEIDVSPEVAARFVKDDATPEEVAKATDAADKKAATK